MSEQQFNPQEWITTAEAAKITGYSKDNLVKAYGKGVLDAVKRGHMLFFHIDDITAYVEEMKKQGAQKFTPKKYR